jgi:membrane fusion protein, multidrug efflux system
MDSEQMEPHEGNSQGSGEDGSKNETAHAKRKRRHRWVWIVVLFLFALLFFAVLRRGETKAASTQSRRAMAGAVPVTTVTAKLGSIGVYLDSIGTVTSVYTNSITAQVTGVINKVHYREGQLVNPGFPLIDLDDRPYVAQLEQAQGTLQHDQYLLSQAEMDLERYRLAWAKNAIPRQTLEDQEKIVKQLEGSVKTDQGLVNFYQVEIAYCHISSPIQGRVGLRLIDPGNLVTANNTTPLVVITQTEPITIIFTIAEDNLDEVLDQMRHGTKLAVEAWDRQMNSLIAKGEVTTVDNQIDTATGTVKLRATFANKNEELFPNEFVNARLAVKTIPNQILIPDSAVQHNGEAAFVYVIQNGQAKMTSVKTGVSNAGIVAVEGIHPGDVVADSSFEKLTDGAKVTISKMQLPSRTSESNAP